MTDIRRYSLAAVILLVVVRLAIGWQLLYEGLWKTDTLGTPRPWTSAGYLRNSVGPMRDTFRNLAGDPDELDWLNYDTVSARWLDWSTRFKEHYRLTDNQAGSMHRLLHGSQKKLGDRAVFGEPLEQLPSGIAKLNVSEKIVWFDPAEKQLYVDASRLLKPREKSKLDALVQDREDAEAVAFRRAVSRVYDRQKSGLGYLRKLAGALKGNPELVGNADWQLVGKREQYIAQLADYEADYAKASTAFEQDHLQYTWGKIQSLRAELTGPIKAMEAGLNDKAEGLLTVAQQAYGPVSEPWTRIRFVDTMTILGLTVLGALLMLGLFTRFAAVAGALMLFNFYLAMPPLPGVPEMPGPEHSFIVNKNLIEVFALLAIAAMPTGLWFGLDRALSVFFKNWTEDKHVSSSLKSTVSTGDEPTGDESIETPEVASATT